MLIGISLPAHCMAAGRSHKQTSSNAPVLSVEAAQANGLSAQDVTEATKLYATKCMRCHKSYEPRVYEQNQWETWMGKMRKKAHLTPEQENVLGRYLGAYRKEGLIARTNAPTPRPE